MWNGTVTVRFTVDGGGEATAEALAERIEQVLREQFPDLDIDTDVWGDDAAS